ncbi:MAG: nicotinamide mononucleotide transporter [Oceanospirillaceae bacterium]|nr:nicotinamide mononucleotide transporter [Oceanospirillaceae bacterium]|tara:strand:- start:367 stop:1011 length:645 start_codon:yes stop_codon:yes gene_type:complete
MNSFIEGVIAGAQAMSLLEVVAVALGLAYLVLAMRQNSWCWYAAFGSTAIYIWLFWSVSLPMESALNVYYLAMAVYGWWVWRHGNTDVANQKTSELPIQSWGMQNHLLAIGGVTVLTLVSGYLLSSFTDAARPYVDSFTTWGAVITTWMVARKVLENWLYWIVVDSVAAWLFFDRELYLTSLLMVIYVGMVVAGWFRWRAAYSLQSGVRAEAAA